MAKANESIVKIWRGDRLAYESLLKNGLTDYWTHYYVKESSGLWTEYFGTVPIKQETGELFPVDTIVSELPENLNPGQRFLVGKDATETTEVEYYVVEIATPIQNTVVCPLGDLSVRVKDRNLYSYQIVNGVLTTYDGDISAGIF